MPELPEVETVVRGLRKTLIGQKISATLVKLPKITASSSNIRPNDLEIGKKFEKQAKNKIISTIERKNKNIIINFIGGSMLLIHLKMTGQLLFNSKKTFNPVANITKHTHIIFTFETGDVMIYNDVRTFGYVLYFESQMEISPKIFNKIGVDPFSAEFTSGYMQKILGYKKPIKDLFLSNHFVCGIGNIYSDEICFGSGIKPGRMCNSLTSQEVEKIFYSIKDKLSHAIQHGGSSISDYVNSQGIRGEYSKYHNVYNRAGKECKKCSEILIKTTLKGRSTVFCRHCQI